MPDTHMRTTSVTFPGMHSWKRRARIICSLLFIYGSFSLPIDLWLQLTKTWHDDFWTVVFATVFALVVVVLVRRISTYPVKSLQNFTLLSGVVLICWVSADTGFKAYTNSSSSFKFDPNRLMTGRRSDPNMWVRELYPSIYAPTHENFVLYKPLQRVSARIYGEKYYPALLQHPLLKDKVLEPRNVTYTIDRYGLRNNVDPAQARIAVLGDSFVFGSEVTDKNNLTSLLTKELSEPVYNLGVVDTSPRQQLYLLKYLLRTYPDTFKLRKLVWMIFEGNDLEDDYSPTAPKTGYKRRNDYEQISSFDKTLMQTVRNIPNVIRQQSIIRAIADGKIRFNIRQGENTESSHYFLDGVLLAQPLYQSKQLGYRLFNQSYINRARESADYVQNHPNMPRLTATIDEMAEFGRLNGIEITIVTVPSAARLYSRQFGLDGISREPYFIQAVAKIAAEQHIAYLDLYTLLFADAEEELLYQRDDSHWNERGNEVVSKLLSSYLR